MGGEKHSRIPSNELPSTVAAASAAAVAAHWVRPIRPVLDGGPFGVSPQVQCGSDNNSSSCNYCYFRNNDMPRVRTGRVFRSRPQFLCSLRHARGWCCCSCRCQGCSGVQLSVLAPGSPATSASLPVSSARHLLCSRRCCRHSCYCWRCCCCSNGSPVYIA